MAPHTIFNCIFFQNHKKKIWFGLYIGQADKEFQN